MTRDNNRYPEEGVEPSMVGIKMACLDGRDLAPAATRFLLREIGRLDAWLDVIQGSVSADGCDNCDHVGIAASRGRMGEEVGRG